MARSDHSIWTTQGGLSHPEKSKQRIRLVKVFGTGTVDFRPILERLYAKIDNEEYVPRIELSDGTSSDTEDGTIPVVHPMETT